MHKALHSRTLWQEMSPPRHLLPDSPTPSTSLSYTSVHYAPTVSPFLGICTRLLHEVPYQVYLAPPLRRWLHPSLTSPPTSPPNLPLAHVRCPCPWAHNITPPPFLTIRSCMVDHPTRGGILAPSHSGGPQLPAPHGVAPRCPKYATPR